MVRYRRNFVAGGTFFFTTTLADRTSHALVQHVDVLRFAQRGGHIPSPSMRSSSCRIICMSS